MAHHELSHLDLHVFVAQLVIPLFISYNGCVQVKIKAKSSEVNVLNNRRGVVIHWMLINAGLYQQWSYKRDKVPFSISIISSFYNILDYVIPCILYVALTALDQLSGQHVDVIFLIFLRIQVLTFHGNCR